MSTELAKIKAIEAEIVPETETITTFKVLDQPSLDLAGQAVKHLATRRKELKAVKESVTKPLNEALKNYRALFKPSETAIAEAEGHLKRQIVAYNAEVEEANRKALEAASEAHQAGDSLAVTDAIDAIVHVDKPPEISMRESLDFEVVDLHEIPWEFLKVEVRRRDIIQALKDGRDVPGVKAVKTKSVVAGR